MPVASSPGQFRSLVDGEIDVAFTSPDNVLAYRFSPTNPLGGVLDVGIVSGIDRGLGLALYGRPGFDGAEALRGARVGVDVPASGFALAMYALTASLGVPRGEYELLALGSTPRRLTALLAGDCDVTMLNAGNELVAEEAGCVRLASVADVCAPYLGTVTAVAGGPAGSPRRGPSAGRWRRDRGHPVGIGRRRGGERGGRPAGRLPRAGPPVRRPAARHREGLLPDAVVDPAALETVAALRRRFLPEAVDGGDVLGPSARRRPLRRATPSSRPSPQSSSRTFRHWPSPSWALPCRRPCPGPSSAFAPALEAAFPPATRPSSRPCSPVPSRSRLPSEQPSPLSRGRRAVRAVPAASASNCLNPAPARNTGAADAPSWMVPPWPGCGPCAALFAPIERAEPEQGHLLPTGQALLDLLEDAVTAAIAWHGPRRGGRSAWTPARTCSRGALLQWWALLCAGVIDT